MGRIKQYECPKCGYTTPVLHFGCGFRAHYEVYICKKCRIIQSIYIGTIEHNIEPKCESCNSSCYLEVWDEKHCPKCGEEMVWGGDWGRNFLIAEWD